MVQINAAGAADLSRANYPRKDDAVKDRAKDIQTKSRAEDVQKSKDTEQAKAFETKKADEKYVERQQNVSQNKETTAERRELRGSTMDISV